MIEHKINELDNFILGWYIKDDELFNEIINFSLNNSKKNRGGLFIKGKKIIDTDLKDSFDSNLYDFKNCSLYYAHLQKVVDLYIKKYPYCNTGSSWLMHDCVNVQHYPSMGGYKKFHCERNSGVGVTASRHLVFMTYLNDVEIGGETEFFHQKLKIRPEKGLTLIWPADWTFTHRGITSPEEKFIVTGWFNYI
jgi:hypothetical protein